MKVNYNIRCNECGYTWLYNVKLVVSEIENIQRTIANRISQLSGIIIIEEITFTQLDLWNIHTDNTLNDLIVC